MRNGFLIKQSVFSGMFAAMMVLASTSLQAELSQGRISFLAGGGGITLKCTDLSFVDYGSYLSPQVEGAPDWLTYTVEDIDDGKWKYSIRFTANSNSTMSDRNATVRMVVGSNLGDYVYENITVTQAAGKLDIKAENNYFWMTEGDGVVTVTGTKGMKWRVTCNAMMYFTGTSEGTITAPPEGSVKVGFHVNENFGGQKRKGKIWLQTYYVDPRGSFYNSWKNVGEVEITQDGCLNYSPDYTNPQSLGGYVSAATPIEVKYQNVNGEEFSLSVDGEQLLSTQEDVDFVWQPLTLGGHEISIVRGNDVWSQTISVASLDYYTEPQPNPPSYEKNYEYSYYGINITPDNATYDVGGGMGAIVTSGTAYKWEAISTAPWIVLNATTGIIGYPVAYQVGASTNVGQRVGYIYVNGHVFTIKQNGYSATVSTSEIECESEGMSGTVDITVPGRYAWDAKPNDNWISITPTHGVGSGTVSYSIAPYNEVSTRSGSFTVGDKTVSVFQYGRRMKLSTYNKTCDYLTHVIPITVNALAVTTWKVTPNASWISVVDGGNGHGGDSVTIAIAENPSAKARTGTVTIGSETFTVTQEGSAVLSLEISPEQSEASVNGANGLISVLATPDLTWESWSSANWLTVMEKFSKGAGNGNVVYVVSPNPTLEARTGHVYVRHWDDEGYSAPGMSKTHTVVQEPALATVSSSGYEFVAAGETASVNVMVSDIVQWTVEESLDWITIQGSASRTGPGTVTISAKENTTIYPRSGTITIAGHALAVSQKARGVEVEYDNILFATGGGGSSFSVHPDGTAAWTAVASDPTWIVIWQNDSGVGDAEVEYIIAPYVGVGTARTGTITVGDKVIYVTQRAYDLDINPQGMWVNGNAGAGEIGVSASIGDVWEAIVTEPWITVVSGYDSGTGSGTVRFTYTENNTGKTRSGKIIVSGEAYTLEQAARTLVPVSSTVEGHGKVEGAVPSLLNSEIELTAVPDAGYEFLYWTGDCGETMQNPVRIMADGEKSVTAHFGPLAPEFTSCESGTDGVKLTWRELAWAVNYRIYRALSNEMPDNAFVMTVAADGCTYLDTEAESGKTYWYWVEAVGVSDATVCNEAVSVIKRRIFPITYSNLQGATHSNPSAYAEGSVVTFSAPSARVGYSFTGWTPSAITADMTGDKTVTAGWRVNGYAVVFNANGGKGIMANEPMTYDAEKSLPTCLFTRTGYTFAGWSMSAGGAVEYANGATVKNLAASGTVTLYAKWKPNSYEVDFNPGQGGSGTMPNQPMTYDEEAALYANLFTRTGYTFVGWTDDENEVEEVLYYDGVVVENLTDEFDGEFDLYAIWMANEYTVKFNANGGEGVMSDQEFVYDEEQNLYLNCFVRAGHSFEGWARSAKSEVAFADGGCASNLTAEADGSATLYARWSANSYTVKFDANGGEGTMSDMDCVYGVSKQLVFNSFTRDGYTFEGWTMSANGEVVYANGAAIKSIAVSGVVTLYAKWKPIAYVAEYNIHFVLEGGIVEESMPVACDAVVKLPTLASKGWMRTGRKFRGWRSSANGRLYDDGVLVFCLANPGGVVTMTAIWE